MAKESVASSYDSESDNSGPEMREVNRDNILNY
jgi:hypothetical protein